MNCNVEHPSSDVLARYVLDGDKNTSISSHIDKCYQCAKSIGELHSVCNSLKSVDPTEFSLEDSNHINDNEIVSYVNNLLSTSIRDSVQHHIDHCGACMKAVLRYRSYLNDAEYSEEKITAVSPTRHLFRVVKNIFVTLFKHRLPVWSVVPTSVVASVAMMLFFAHPNSEFFHPENTRPNIALSNVNNQSPVMKVAMQKTGNSINWYEGYIETTAIGTSNVNQKINTIQAEQLALKAARHTAYANITELLNGISVDANTSYKNLITNEDALKVKSQGFIRGGQIISHQVDWQDGSPKATVTVRVPLYGRDGAQGLLKQKPVQKLQTNAIVKTAALEDSTYSGIIIDARNTLFTPSMTAQLQTQHNELLFSSRVGGNPNTRTGIATDISTDIPAVHYYSSIESALGSNQYGDNPVVIRASTANNKGSLQVRNKHVINLLQNISGTTLKGATDRTINIAIIFD